MTVMMANITRTVHIDQTVKVPLLKLNSWVLEGLTNINTYTTKPY